MYVIVWLYKGRLPLSAQQDRKRQEHAWIRWLQMRTGIQAAPGTRALSGRTEFFMRMTARPFRHSDRTESSRWQTRYSINSMTMVFIMQRISRVVFTTALTTTTSCYYY